jgi:hypothetical protein
MLALPFAAGAEELFLQYEGTVSGVQGCRSCVDFEEGDAIRGLLKINTALAPADSDPDPDRAQYGNWGLPLDFERSPDFVKGFSRSSGPASDGVVVSDRRHEIPQGAGLDEYGAIDAEHVGTPRQNVLTIAAQSIRNLFEDTGIVQTFDLKAGDEGVSFFGAIYRGTGKFLSEVYFSLSRVSLTPGSCRAS